MAHCSAPVLKDRLEREISQEPLAQPLLKKSRLSLTVDLCKGLFSKRHRKRMCITGCLAKIDQLVGPRPVPALKQCNQQASIRMLILHVEELLFHQHSRVDPTQDPYINLHPPTQTQKPQVMACLRCHGCGCGPVGPLHVHRPHCHDAEHCQHGTSGHAILPETLGGSARKNKTLSQMRLFPTSLCGEVVFPAASWLRPPPSSFLLLLLLLNSINSHHSHNSTHSTQLNSHNATASSVNLRGCAVVSGPLWSSWSPRHPPWRGYRGILRLRLESLCCKLLAGTVYRYILTLAHRH